MSYKIFFSRTGVGRTRPNSVAKPEDFCREELLALRQAVVKMRRDLKIIHEEDAAMQYLAPRDTQKDLPDRRQFCDQLEQTFLERCPMFAIILICLDGLEALDDSYGPGVGDCLAHLAAARLMIATPARGYMSRIDTHQFACLITGVKNAEGLEEVGSRLFKAASDPFLMRGAFMTVSPIMGLAAYPANGRTMAELLSAAEDALRTSRRAAAQVARVSQERGTH